MQRNEHFITQRCYGEDDKNWPFVDMRPLRLGTKLAGLRGTCQDLKKKILLNQKHLSLSQHYSKELNAASSRFNVTARSDDTSNEFMEWVSTGYLKVSVGYQKQSPVQTTPTDCCVCKFL